MSKQAQLIGDHLQHLQTTWEQGLAAAGYDAVLLHAGSAQMHFRDDQGPAFKANPYLLQWVAPEFINPGARCLIQPGQPAKLFLHRPSDYWHSVPADPEYLAEYMEFFTFTDLADLQQASTQACPGNLRVAEITPTAVSMSATIQPGQPEAGQNEHINPQPLLDFADYYRACKTPYEIELMRRASDIGARGHLAAQSAFAGGGSEFEVHMAYLLASAQNETELPYGNIIGINEHAGILHYQHQQRQADAASRSLLIDAGGDTTRNLVAGGLHLLLWKFGVQGDDYRYDMRPMAKGAKVFHFQNQVYDNMFWSYVALQFWTFFGRGAVQISRSWKCTGCPV